MLDKQTLKLDEIFAPDVLWELRPSELPGRVGRYLFNAPGQKGFIEVLAPICYPDGRLMGEVFCGQLNGLGCGSLVLFTLVPASEYERSKKGQPDLMQTGSLREATQEEIDAATEQVSYARVEQLGRTLEQMIGDLDRQRAALESAVEARVAEERAKLAADEGKLRDREADLETRESGVEQEVREKVGVAVEKRLLELEQRSLEVETREKKAKDRESAVATAAAELRGQRDELARAKAEFREQGGESFQKFLSSLASPEDAEEAPKALPDTPPPADLLLRMRSGLTEHGYVVEEPILIQCLLSIAVAASTGQFIILTGPTGVGKTSIASMMASALGAGWGVVPVRPAWIDPSDLLGFYNPQQDEFQPTPFMDRFLEARRFTAANRLYLLTLDEMNLSRVENYAADFLSRLEKARSGEHGAWLSLYALDLEQRLRAKIKDLWQAGPLGEVEQRRIEMLLRHVERYPARIDIPEGLTILGTINLDETTYLFSPKFLDRSLIIQIPTAALPEQVSSARMSRLLAKPVWELSVATAKALTEEAVTPSKEVSQVWSDLRRWQASYLTPLGIRLGFRFPQTFQRYMAAATKMGLKDVQGTAATFFQAKLLPWISFHRDDHAVGIGDSKLDILGRWSTDQSLGAYPGLKSSMQRMIDRGGLVVQYLE